MVHDVNNKPAYDNIEIPGQRLYVGPASPIKRLLAFTIDLLIINMVFLMPFQGLISRIVPKGDFFSIINTTFSIELILLALFIGTVMLLYFTIFEFFMAQTPGKMFFSLFVVSIKQKDKKLQKLSFWQTIIRNIFLIPVFPFALLILIDPIFVFFNHNSQRLLEMLSKTVVIERFSYDSY